MPPNKSTNVEQGDFILKFTALSSGSVQFSSVMSNSLQHQGLKHTRLPCPSPTPTAQVHRVGDSIKPSHPLLSPSSPAFSLSQHHGLFQWISSSYQVGQALEFQLQCQSFWWIFRTDFFQIDWLDLFAVQGQHHSSNHNSLVLSLLYSPTLISIHDYRKNHIFD